VSSAPWVLDLDTERAILLPWLLSEPDEVVRGRVTDWLASLVRAPVGHGREEVLGVFSARVPRTDVVVVWTLDHDQRIVRLALVG
jgi:hypothetical protein